MAIKVGFIGTGGMASAHFNRMKNLPVEFVGLCDTDEERAQAAANELGGKAYTDYKKMLDEVEMDACWVCVPPFAHGDAEKAVIDRGVHLFVEKPIALDMGLAREISAMIDEKGIISSVGYHWRYMATVDAAKQVLGSRDVGMMLGWWIGGMPGVWWWRQMETSGGQAVEQTTHIFDLARYFAGDVTEVYAAHAQRFLHKEVENFDVDDVGTVTLKFENGAIANISSGCLGGYRVGLDIISKDLVIQVGSGSQLNIAENGERRTETHESDGYFLEDQVFIDAVKRNDPSAIRSTYADAVKTLHVTLAANESAKTGQPVRLV